MSKAPVSPFATGGGGEGFEHLVATSYVTSLLRRELPRGLEDGIATAVNLQQRNRGYAVDDIIVVATADGTAASLALQAKHRLQFTDNALFRSVLADCWSHFNNRHFDWQRDRVGVAISEISNTQAVKNSLQNLLAVARTSSDAASFFEKSNLFTRQRQYRDLFAHVLCSVAGAQIADEMVWRLLAAFEILPFDFDSPGARDSWLCWNSLCSLVPDGDAEDARAVFGRLYEIVGHFSKRGGEITPDTLRRELSGPLYTKLTYRTQLDLTTLSATLSTQLDRQLARERHSRKYIPSIFVESNKAKDNARRFCVPTLFTQKLVQDLQLVDRSFLNRTLRRLGLPELALPVDSFQDMLFTLRNLDANCRSIKKVIEDAQQVLSAYTVVYDASPLPGIPADKEYLWKDLSHVLSNAAQAVSRRLDELLNDLRFIEARVLFVIGRAGQGKTNFLCNLADTVLRTRNVPCLLYSGRSLISSPSTQLPRAIASSIVERATTLSDALLHVQSLCRLRNAPLVIAIDGLNEHVDISTFAVVLEQLIDDMVDSAFVRVILACREEYFESRFGNLIKASFRPYTVTLHGVHGRITQRHKRRLREGYFDFFRLSCPSMSGRVVCALEDDPLLLRIFCEVYGDHGTSETIRLPPQYDIYKDDLFNSYLKRKLDALATRQAATGGSIVGARDKYRHVLATVIAHMVDTRCFVDVPVLTVPSTLHAALDELLYEDIIFRKDLSSRQGVLDATTEVINFTFDEFRDFLIADHIASRLTLENAGFWTAVLTELTDSKSAIAEGVSRYLFYAAKRKRYPDLQPLICDQPWFREAFVECIFDVEDEFIDVNDVRHVRSRYGKGPYETGTITRSMIRRCYQDRYPMLNIGVLFSWWDAMDDSEFSAVVQPVFKRGLWMAEDGAPADYLDHIGSQVLKLAEGPEREHQLASVRLVEVMLYLLDVNELANRGELYWALTEVHSRTPHVVCQAIFDHIQHAPARSRAGAFGFAASLAPTSTGLPDNIVGQASEVLERHMAGAEPDDVVAACAAETVLAAHEQGFQVSKALRNNAVALTMRRRRYATR